MPDDLVPPELLERFRNRDCVFFIGAGVSTEAGLPSGPDFKEILIDKINYPRTEATLSKVAQALEDTIDRPTLIDLIIDTFDKRVAPPESYRIIAKLVKEGLCAHIITTNYEHLIEDALKADHCEYHVSKRDSEVGSVGSKRAHLIKFHGSISDTDTIVITETDYRKFFRERPVLRNLLGGLLVEKTFIFLGFSLEDPDFDQIYHEITTNLGDFQRLSYAVQLKPRGFTDDQWNRFHVARWTRRKIRIITANAVDFLTELDKKLHSAAGAIPAHKRTNPALVWSDLRESILENTALVVTNEPMLDCTFEIEFRMEDDRGRPTNWFGVRLRGLTSNHYAGYLIYLRSNGNLDIVSVEERSILDREVQAIDPKLGFVKMKVSLIGDQIRVWVNDDVKVEERNALVTWPGRVYLHAFGTKVTFKAAQLFEER